MLALPYIGVVNPAIIAQGHGMSLGLRLQEPALHCDGSFESVGLVIQYDGAFGRTLRHSYMWPADPVSVV